LLILSYVPTWSGFLYLSVVINVFSRRVIGWAMETLVLKAPDMALSACPDL
jgi:putative transposase